jgi:hypothetical protein
LVFEQNANFFAENCQKSPKIVTITSTPAITKVFHLQFGHTDVVRTLLQYGSSVLEHNEVKRPGVDVTNDQNIAAIGGGSVASKNVLLMKKLYILHQIERM